MPPEKKDDDTLDLCCAGGICCDDMKRKAALIRLLKHDVHGISDHEAAGVSDMLMTRFGPMFPKGVIEPAVEYIQEHPYNK